MELGALSADTITFLHNVLLSAEEPMVQSGETDGYFLKRHCLALGIELQVDNKAIKLSDGSFNKNLSTLVLAYDSAEANIETIDVEFKKPTIKRPKKISPPPSDAVQPHTPATVTGEGTKSTDSEDKSNKVEEERMRVPTTNWESVPSASLQIDDVGDKFTLESADKLLKSGAVGDVLEAAGGGALPGGDNLIAQIKSDDVTSSTSTEVSEKTRYDQAAGEWVDVKGKKPKSSGGGTSNENLSPDSEEIAGSGGMSGGVQGLIFDNNGNAIGMSDEEPLAPGGYRIDQECLVIDAVADDKVTRSRKRKIIEGKLVSIKCKLKLGSTMFKVLTPIDLVGVGKKLDGPYRVEKVDLSWGDIFNTEVTLIKGHKAPKTKKKWVETTSPVGKGVWAPSEPEKVVHGYSVETYGSSELPAMDLNDSLDDSGKVNAHGIPKPEIIFSEN